MTLRPRSIHLSRNARTWSGDPRQTNSRIRNICMRTGSIDGSCRKQYDDTSTTWPPGGSGPRAATMG